MMPFPFFVGRRSEEGQENSKLWLACKIESRTKAIVLTNFSDCKLIEKNDYNPHQHLAVDHYLSGKYKLITEKEFEELKEKIIKSL